MTNTKRSPDGAKQLALAILDVMDTGAKGKQRIGVTEMGELFWQALQLPENVQKMTIEEIARARGIDPPVFENGVGRKHWLQVLYADQPELLVVKPGAKDSPAGRRFTDALIRWERKRVLSPREQRGRRNDATLRRAFPLLVQVAKTDAERRTLTNLFGRLVGSEIVHQWLEWSLQPDARLE